MKNSQNGIRSACFFSTKTLFYAPMKFFVLLLCCIPHISFGLFDGYRSFDDNNGNPYDRTLFEESLDNLSSGFGLLIILSMEGYAPAQQMLGFMSQDFRKARNYLKNYNNEELIPIQPSLRQSRNILRQIWDVLFNIDISTVVNEEKATFSFSVIFHESLESLTEGLRLLDILKNRDYEPAREFQDNFEARIADVMKESGLPVYPLSKKLNQKCQRIFANYFVPVNKINN